MIRGGSGGTLGPLVWFFCACLFYMLPVIWLGKYIGGWAWPAGIGFWALAAAIIGCCARLRRSKSE